jgi:D-glycero-D-manno-heptose 1,7-bisphosphate phosphatase
LRRALILDRDGVIVHDPGYLYRVEDCRFTEGVFAMTRSFAAAQFKIVIATNQSGIGRGLYGEEDFQRLMGWMREEFASHGVALAGIYHSPYHPTEGIGAYRRDSDLRKPRPGMLLRAAADLGLDLAASWCVGDQMTDVEAGRAAGVGTLVRLDSACPSARLVGDCWVVPYLAAVTELLGRAESSPGAVLRSHD